MTEPTGKPEYAEEIWSDWRFWDEDTGEEIPAGSDRYVAMKAKFLEFLGPRWSALTKPPRGRSPAAMKSNR